MKNPIERSTEDFEGLPEFDPEHPVTEPHGSHDWEAGSFFLTCIRCGTRDHWPAARRSCVKVPSPRAPAPHTLAEAVRLLYLDLDAFAVWWLARESVLGLVRPSLAEWRAEFLEWSKGANPEREA